MKNRDYFKFNHVYFSLFLLLTLVPSLVWIFNDRQLWPWDQAWYAEVSTELFYQLSHQPITWGQSMISAFGIKAPGLAWLGQFFVPIGEQFGSIEIGLLLSIIFTQAMVLILSYLYLIQLTKSRLISFISCLVISSSSLWLGLTHQYFVEPLQTLAITWIILILVYTPEWRINQIFFHLLGAFSLAMISKVTSPLYSVVAIIIILFYVLIKFFNKLQKKLNIKKFIVMVIQKLWKNFNYWHLSCIFLALATFLWYAKNWQTIVSFTLLASSGQASLLYGEKASFWIKFQYWLTAFQKNFLTTPLVFFVWGCCLYLLLKFLLNIRNRNQVANPLSHFDICAITSVLQITIVLVVFSLNINEENRYLLPLLPYFAIIFSWILVKINHRLTLLVACGILIFQLIMVNAQALGLTSINQNLSDWLYSLNNNTSQREILKSVIDTTCRVGDEARYNIIGVELPWFNANSVSFFSAKQLSKKGFRCYYTSLGYAENNFDKAWQRMIDLNINYFITLSPKSGFKIDAFNQVSLPILKKIKEDSLFKPVDTIDNHSILLYKRILFQKNN
jgi:hypothetical protein